MTRSEIFKKAHKLAKSFVGNYLACFSLALKTIYKQAKELFMAVVEVRFSMAKTICGKGVVLTLTGDNAKFGRINPEALGYKMLTTNEWKATCYTPAEIDAARNPLKAFITNRRVGSAVILEA